MSFFDETNDVESLLPKIKVPATPATPVDPSSIAFFHSDSGIEEFEEGDDPQTPLPINEQIDSCRKEIDVLRDKIVEYTDECNKKMCDLKSTIDRLVEKEFETKLPTGLDRILETSSISSSIIMDELKEALEADCWSVAAINKDKNEVFVYFDSRSKTTPREDSEKKRNDLIDNLDRLVDKMMDEVTQILIVYGEDSFREDYYSYYSYSDDSRYYTLNTISNLRQ